MTDVELSEFLGIENHPGRDEYIRRLSPEKRAAYERMKVAYEDILIFEAGGPPPPGVVVCGRRR